VTPGAAIDWNALTAISTFATFLVIAASATAAIVQIRHIRAGNQIATSLALMDRVSNPDFQRIIQYVFHGELDKRMEDPAYRAELLIMPVDMSQHPEVQLLMWWDQMGSVLKLGHSSEEAFMDTTSLQCIAAWQKLGPVVAYIRRARGPQVYDNFEWLASRSMLWERRHPNGTFPNNAPHLPLADIYPE
jgi:hypothetical protein